MACLIIVDAVTAVHIAFDNFNPIKIQTSIKVILSKAFYLKGLCHKIFYCLNEKRIKNYNLTYFRDFRSHAEVITFPPLRCDLSDVKNCIRALMT